MVIKSVQSGLLHPVADTMKSNAAKESPIWPMTSRSIFSSVNVLEIKLSVSNMQWLMGHWSVVIFHSKLETGSIQNVLQKTESFFVKLVVDKMNRDIVCNQMMNIWRNMKNSICEQLILIYLFIQTFSIHLFHLLSTFHQRTSSKCWPNRNFMFSWNMILKSCANIDFLEDFFGRV